METPEEGIDRLVNQIQAALADDLLEAIKGCSPAFF